MFNVYAKIKHEDGQIETRLWLQGFSTYGEAKKAAAGAVMFNDCVIEAWII